MDRVIKMINSSESELEMDEDLKEEMKNRMFRSGLLRRINKEIVSGELSDRQFKRLESMMSYFLSQCQE